MVTFTVLVQGYVISLGAISGHLPSVLIVEQKLESSIRITPSPEALSKL